MAKIKIFGQEITVRGSNKLHTILDDIDMLYSELQTMSIAQLAKKLDVPPNSIRHRVNRYFLPEMKANIKRQRREHSNRSKKATNR